MRRFLMERFVRGRNGWTKGCIIMLYAVHFVPPPLRCISLWRVFLSFPFFSFLSFPFLFFLFYSIPFPVAIILFFGHSHPVPVSLGVVKLPIRFAFVNLVVIIVLGDFQTGSDHQEGIEALQHGVAFLRRRRTSRDVRVPVRRWCPDQLVAVAIVADGGVLTEGFPVVSDPVVPKAAPHETATKESIVAIVVVVFRRVEGNKPAEGVEEVLAGIASTGGSDSDAGSQRDLKGTIIVAVAVAVVIAIFDVISVARQLQVDGRFRFLRERVEDDTRRSHRQVRFGLVSVPGHKEDLRPRHVDVSLDRNGRRNPRCDCCCHLPGLWWWWW
mmetsp:Transcript_26241/g.72040  ORF Transcript_26241/g.72040 Transcript_26241/m.72040 type:complete len:327 (+) Transcript_26241:283-1263(+)